jgi:hypothetical protein
MQMMQITIQKMWPLEAGRKSGGFKGTDGTNYYCEIPIYHMLSEGMTIDAPAEKYVSKAGKTSYIIDKKWNPAPNGHEPKSGAQYRSDAVPSGCPSPPPYVAKDDELITRLAILKSLIESGALLQGEQSMDDLVEMAWTTAPKLKVWQR